MPAVQRTPLTQISSGAQGPCAVAKPTAKKRPCRALKIFDDTVLGVIIADSVPQQDCYAMRVSEKSIRAFGEDFPAHVVIDGSHDLGKILGRLLCAADNEGRQTRILVQGGAISVRKALPLAVTTAFSAERTFDVSATNVAGGVIIDLATREKLEGFTNATRFSCNAPSMFVDAVGRCKAGQVAVGQHGYNQLTICTPSGGYLVIIESRLETGRTLRELQNPASILCKTLLPPAAAGSPVGTVLLVGVRREPRVLGRGECASLRRLVDTRACMQRQEMSAARDACQAFVVRSLCEANAPASADAKVDVRWSYHVAQVSTYSIDVAQIEPASPDPQLGQSPTAIGLEMIGAEVSDKIAGDQDANEGSPAHAILMASDMTMAELLEKMRATLEREGSNNF